MTECICGHPGLTYDGPVRDCPVHGEGEALGVLLEHDDSVPITGEPVEGRCGRCGAAGGQLPCPFCSGAAEVTPTWWEWRQQQAETVPFDYEQMRAMVAEARERQERFAALFRRQERKT